MRPCLRFGRIDSNGADSDALDIVRSVVDFFEVNVAKSGDFAAFCGFYTLSHARHLCRLISICFAAFFNFGFRLKMTSSFLGLVTCRLPRCVQTSDG